MIRKWFIWVCVSIGLAIGPGTERMALADTPRGEPVKPLLRRLLAETPGLSERDRALYAYIIDHYLPECPEKQFSFTGLEEALRAEDPGDGTLIVNTFVACDETKNKPDMLFVGEYLRLNPDFSLRVRLDSYKPVGETASKLEAARKRLEEERLNPPPELSEEELRQAQADSLFALLDNAKDVGEDERRAYREMVTNHLPVCVEEEGPSSFETVHDAVWLSEFNGGYLAVSLIVCGWNDLDAFWLDEQGKLKGRFTLPAGKYGLSPPHEFHVGDYTGDGRQEFYYRKTFPVSSVPAFATRVQLYKPKPGDNTPRLILDTQVEEQDCFGAERSGNNAGSRKTAELEFVPARGLIKITEEESEFDCSDFSWGEKPVRTLKTIARRHKVLRWDPSRFAYVPAGGKR